MIRNYKSSDAEQILEIYRPYIENSAISFENVVPSLDEFVKRLNEIAEKYPFLILEKEGQIAAYAYANSYRSREAYQWSVETSIYMKQANQGSGEASQLYSILLEKLSELQFQKAYAVITMPNPRSVRFHEKLGFKDLALFEKAGFKLGQWHSIFWMEKELNNSNPTQAPLFGKKN